MEKIGWSAIVRTRMSIFWAIVVLIPLIYLLYFVTRYGVNIPWWDEWTMVDFLQKATTGNASLQDWLALHNEHRMIFPRIIFTAFVVWTDWNTHYEMYLSVFLSVLSFGLISWMAARQTPKKATPFWLSTLFTSIMMFSVVQSENWLWGFQVAWFLICLCFIGGIASLEIAERSRWRNFSLAALCCTIASFSSAHGLLTWIGLLPSVWSFQQQLDPPSVQNLWVQNLSVQNPPAQNPPAQNPSDQNPPTPFRQLFPYRFLLIWFGLATLVIALYLVGYSKPAPHPETHVFLEKPLLALTFALSFLGSPMLYHSKFSWIWGAIALLSYLMFGIRFLRQPRSRFAQQAAPWLSMGLFAIAFAAITTVGRVGFGLEMAYSSRYTTVSLLLLMGLVHLWRLLAVRWSRRRWECLGLSGMLTVLVLITSFQQADAVHTGRMERPWMKACLEVTPALKQGLDSCMLRIFPHPNMLRDFVQDLNQMGVRHDPQQIPFVDVPDRQYGYLDTTFQPPRAPIIQKSCLNCSSEMPMTGWAVDPKRRKAAPLVLITYSSGDRPHQHQPLTTTPVGIKSRDVEKALKIRAYSKVRWSTTIPIQSLPLGEGWIRAWAYDTRGNRFMKLGELKMTVQRGSRS